MNPLDPTLSPEIREWLEAIHPLWEATGISRRKFAKAAYIDQSAISRYLRGERVPTTGAFLDELLKVAEDKGIRVGSEERQRLVVLHTAAMRVATPQEYRVRIVNQKLQIALDAREKAESEASELKELLGLCVKRLAELQVENIRIEEDWRVERESLSTEIARLERELADARGRVDAAAGWVKAAREGLEISIAYLEADRRRLEQLTKLYGAQELGSLTERFVVAGLVATEVLSMNGERMPFQQALSSVTPRPRVALFEELHIGPWPEVLALASAFREGGDAAARQVPLTMDVPGAINVSFRFMISALTGVTRIPELSFKDPTEVARVLIESLDLHASTT